MSRILKKVYAAKRTINYGGGCKKAGTGAEIGRSGLLANFVRSQTNTPVPAAPAAPVPPASIDKFFAYVANQGGNTISAFTIDETTGALAKIKVNNVTIPDVDSGANPISIIVDPTRKFVYVANNGSGTISAFTIDQTTGILAKIKDINGTVIPDINIGQPRSIAVIGNFLYCSSRSVPESVLGYTIGSNGALTNIINIAVPGFTLDSIAIDSVRKFLYVSARDMDALGNNCYSYKIETDGTLTFKNKFNIGSVPSFIAIDPIQKNLYVADDNTIVFRAFTIDETTGDPTLKGEININNSTQSSVTFTPSKNFVYTTLLNNNTVAALTINQTTGEMTINNTLATGTTPSSVTVDPTEKFVYVTNQDSNTISAFTINQDTGALTKITQPGGDVNGNVATGLNPKSVITVRIIQ